MSQPKNKFFITLGCSWTLGVGANYNDGMTEPDLQEVAWIDDEIEPLSFRKQISNKLGFDHINLAEGGSSNQRQFRRAREFFLAKDQEWFDNHELIVLWALTSLYRNDLFNVNTMDYDKLMLTRPNGAEISRILLTDHFDQQVELKTLSEHMKMFDNFFEHKKITNYWVNTFNPHKYPHQFPNLLFHGMDLLSKLTNDLDDNNQYHLSDWEHDTDRKITKAKEHKLVNPISGHPTRAGHKIIANLIYNHIFTR
jgi:hypothetical protein